MSEVDKKIKDTVENGGTLALLYFDIHAKEKDNLVALSKAFVKEIINKEGVVLALGEIEEPVPPEKEGMNWSTYVTVKVLTKDFKTLSALCLSHSPFNVEILKPDEIKLTLPEAHELLAMLSAVTADYKRYILTKLATPEELTKLQENLKRRAEMEKVKK